MFQFGRKRVFDQVETFFSKTVHSSALPCLKNTRREKMTFLDKKKKKTLSHIAMFAENDGGVYCAKPQIF